MHSSTIRGQVVDIRAKSIYKADLFIEDGKISKITKLDSKEEGLPFIIPGFVDSHVHIESSLLIPSQFARLAVVHGTVATVSDPHEIANVCGIEGVEYMINDGKQVPLKFFFGAPSCVPATVFETAGDSIDVEAVEKLLDRSEIKYLSEMMNFPGVINDDKAVLDKIKAAKLREKPVDGHAPGLRGTSLDKYISAGISTDHECFTKEEAQEKLEKGMKILIREGSAAKNFEALVELLSTFPEQIMFCSDDKHPDSLIEGHINQLCARAVAKGIDTYNVLQAACINPVKHYNLDVGLLEEGDPADFILVKDLNLFQIISTYIDGDCVYNSSSPKTSINAQPKSTDAPNRFARLPIVEQDLIMNASEYKGLPVIEALDGQLITRASARKPSIQDDVLKSNLHDDVLKIVVVNRYQQAPIAKAFITNFGFKHGAIASSVAHDSHNIVAVGVDDADLVAAINEVIKSKGGLSCVTGSSAAVLALPVAGLMSDDDGYAVANKYIELDKTAKSLGSPLSSPFMTLSFMALLVIPDVKLSDKGLFNGKTFSFFKEERI